MLWSAAASMPSNQIFFSVMFVGKCSCTSHVLQYSSSLSYEHSRSLQSFLCSGAVTVLICWASLHVFSPQQSWCKHRFACMACRKRSFFVAALLNLHNFEKRRQNYILFYIPPNFSAFFLHIQKNWHRFLLFFHYFFVPFAPTYLQETMTRHEYFGEGGWCAKNWCIQLLVYLTYIVLAQ